MPIVVFFVTRSACRSLAAQRRHPLRAWQGEVVAPPARRRASRWIAKAPTESSPSRPSRRSAPCPGTNNRPGGAPAAPPARTCALQALLRLAARGHDRVDQHCRSERHHDRENPTRHCRPNDREHEQQNGSDVQTHIAGFTRAEAPAMPRPGRPSVADGRRHSQPLGRRAAVPRPKGSGRRSPRRGLKRLSTPKAPVRHLTARTAARGGWGAIRGDTWGARQGRERGAGPSRRRSRRRSRDRNRFERHPAPRELSRERPGEVHQPRLVQVRRIADPP